MYQAKRAVSGAECAVRAGAVPAKQLLQCSLSLQTLKLGECSLLTHLPTELGACVGLERLDLRDCLALTALRAT